ncbi:MAG: hypothetical protein KatS3mg020_0052 [Fimbriimonadales bacterium]|nr:MAG: hypothetical protein KatS3mg020_0052 [Fimbriimonadales bacterium]
MQSSILRRMVIAYSVVLTLLTGALTTAQILNGLMVYANPDATRDGQYFMVFGIGGAVGFVMALPAGLLAGVWIARDPDFAPLLNKALLVCLVIGVSIGVVLAGLGAGINGLLWAAIGIGIVLLGLAVLPLVVFVLPSTMPVSALVALALLLVVVGTYGYYRRAQPSHPEA